MSGFEKQTYTQVPNSLFEIMHDMDECELKVVLYICRYTFGYHRDEVKISTRKLAKEIKMSVASVDKGADAAVKRGLIERITDGQNTTLWRAIVSDSKNESPDGDTENESPVTQKVNRSDSENESQVGVKERVKQKRAKEILKGSSVDWAVLAGQDVDPETIKANQEREAALAAFELAFHCSAPWGQDRAWEKMEKFVIQVHKKNPAVFSEYVDWRENGKGKYGVGMSNLKIRQNPQMFMDTGYPTFAASVAMYPSKAKEAANGHRKYIDNQYADYLAD